MVLRTSSTSSTLVQISLGIFVLVNFPTSSSGTEECQPGLILPVWQPQTKLDLGERIARGTVYFLGMLYMFIGVSIISDRFMGAIEVITSKEKEIKVKRPTGEVQIVVVRVWNETVANLTLMALGSSAPEILLSIIEIIGKNFESGELGPGTIVGSAAFNLLIIIAICVYVIPEGEVRRIKHLRVFFVTAAWSLFAYIWLLLILIVITPGVVDIWEGLITFLFFPATVITAYIADRRLLIYKFLSKSYRLNKRGLIVEGEGNQEMNRISESGLKIFEEENMSDEIREFEQNRRDYIQMLRDLRKKHPDTETEALEALAREEILSKGPKSRAFYRMQATRKLTSGQNLMKRIQGRAASESMDPISVHVEEEKGIEPHITEIFFDPAHYTVMESVGTFDVTVTRQGGDLNQVALVNYITEDGTASSEADYIPVNGTLTFEKGETHKKISIQVLDDDVFEEDEHFYIRLSHARFAHGSGGRQVNGSSGSQSPKQLEVQLVSPFLATVMILDDDHGGIFNIVDKDMETVESIGALELRLSRWSGARGKVLLPYTTIEGTAKPGKDYEHVEGKLLFENNETEKVIIIPIIEEESYEKDVLFYLEISDPIPLGDNDVPISNSSRREDMTKAEIIALEGWPKLGSDSRAQIRIKESKEFKNTVDKLLQRANASLLVGTSSWKEQFLEAITVNAGGDDDDDDDIKSPSCGDYAMHFLTIFWKVIFAFVPPTDIWDGYLTFVVSILGIGVLTAFIGDLASHLGCTIGLKDSVTAIAFVALGTSVPDTFASKVAAVQDEYADASIGNVTGSNAVNVFLGLGIAWTIAAVVHSLRSCSTKDCNVFKVDPGSLGFSVTLFCACAVVAIALMLIRRLPTFGGGELGGPKKYKLATTLLFVSLWIFYVIMSSMEAYNIIEGF